MPAPFACSVGESLPSAPDGWHVVDYAPLADGRLACLHSTADIWAIHRDNRDLRSKGQWERQRPHLAASDRGRLSIVGNAGPIAEFPLEYPFPAFDRLSDGGWILVNVRCPAGALNALRLNRRGEVVTRFAVGDGVEHIQADDEGGIWVGHFDEGLTDPLGAAGVGRFDVSGHLNWAANGCGDIDLLDCYALNVAGDEAWACYYTDFPILRVRLDGEYRVWTNDVGGARAIAVEGNHVVLLGGYEEKASRIALLELGERSATLVGELVLTGPDVTRGSVSGRGDTIHMVENGFWRRFTVAEIVEAVAAAGDASNPRPKL